MVERRLSASLVLGVAGGDGNCVGDGFDYCR